MILKILIIYYVIGLLIYIPEFKNILKYVDEADEEDKIAGFEYLYAPIQKIILVLTILVSAIMWYNLIPCMFRDLKKYVKEKNK